MTLNYLSPTLYEHVTNDGQPIIQPAQAEQQLPVFPPNAKPATLSHAKSSIIERHALLDLPLPEPTPTWQPVPFSEIIGTLDLALNRQRIAIIKEQIAISEDKLKMFATFDLIYGRNKEFTAALGLRTSNNKTISIQMAVGARVFVCDNMSFSGDMIALRRKHTTRIKLHTEIEQGLDRYLKQYDALVADIARLKGKMLLDKDAKALICHAFGVEALPVRLFHPVMSSYRDVRANGYVSKWQLHNCFTLHAQALPPQRRFQATADIGKVFEL